MLFSGSCLDSSTYCAKWASEGHCENSYMLDGCKKSCKTCGGMYSFLQVMNSAHFVFCNLLANFVVVISVSHSL